MDTNDTKRIKHGHVVSVLHRFIEAIEKHGGVVKENGQLYLMHGEDWPELAELYMAAKSAFGESGTAMVAEVDDDDGERERLSQENGEGDWMRCAHCREIIYESDDWLRVGTEPYHGACWNEYAEQQMDR